MDSSGIEFVLRKLISSDLYKKIFINGDWGVGKSYYAKKFINDYNNNVLYISLFGKPNYESIEKSILNELIKKLSRFEKFKKYVKKIKGFSTPIFGLDFASDFENDIIGEYSRFLNDDNIILIIDDLERKSEKVSIEDVMGLIEQLSVCEKLKIVIIGCESKQSPTEKQKWIKFKEKVIDKEYKIEKYSSDAINNLIINRLNYCIEKHLLTAFIHSFFIKHKTNNLRIINKGINLFIEVKKECLKKKYSDSTYLAVLKNCMAVSIESNEKLYKDSKLPLEERILKYYLNDIIISNKESSILPYILIFNKQRTDYSFKLQFNRLVEDYIEIQPRRDLFYLSKAGIKKELKSLYKSILEKKYEYHLLEIFLDDVNDLIDWNKRLDLNFDIILLEQSVIEILNDEYYGYEDFSKNLINNFEIKRRNSTKLMRILEKYNNQVIDRYILDTIDRIDYLYEAKRFDSIRFSWLDNEFIDKYNDRIMDKFIVLCKKNKYFIPKLSGKLTDDEWNLVKRVYNLFNKSYNKKYRDGFMDYVSLLKKKDALVKYRLDTLENK